MEENKQPTTEKQNEEVVTENQLEGLHVLDWFKIEKEFPLSMQALKDWLLTRYDIPNLEVVVDQFSILVTNGAGGMYLNPRDLYDFFDAYEIRPFVVPEEKYPQVKYLIQSKKSFKESEEVYNERAAAEIASFIKTFFFVEVTIQHEIDKKKQPIISNGC